MRKVLITVDEGVEDSEFLYPYYRTQEEGYIVEMKDSFTVATKLSSVRILSRRGKVIAALCRGQKMLIEADAIRGKKVTCYKSVKTDVINAGATCINAPPVADGKLVTSRFPADLPKFCKETTELPKMR